VLVTVGYDKKRLCGDLGVAGARPSGV